MSALLIPLIAVLRRRHDEEGATAVEYGIMVALIAAVIIAAVIVVGNGTRDSFQCVSDRLDTPAAAC